MTGPRTYPSLVSLYSSTVVCILFFEILGAFGAPPWSVPPAGLLAASALSYGINRFLLQKERELWQLLLANGLLFCGLLAAFALTDLLPDGNALFLLGCALLYLLTRGCRLVFSPATLSSSRMHLEYDVVCLAVYIWIGSLSTMHASQILWLLSSCAAGLSAVLYFRLAGSVRGVRSVRSGGAAALILALGAVLGISALLLAFAAKPAGELLLTLLQTGGRLLRFLWKCIEQFFIWLDSHLTVRSGTAPSMQPDFNTILPEEETLAEANPYAALVFIAAVLLAAVCAGLWLLWRLRRRRISVRSVRAPGAPARSRAPLFAALRQALAAFWERLSLRIAVLLHGTHSVGLYLRLSRACRFSRFSQKPGDTPRSFLARLSGGFSAQGDSKSAAQLLCLADAVDAALYAGAPGFGAKTQNACEIFSKTVSLVRRPHVKEPPAAVFSDSKGI